MPTLQDFHTRNLLLDSGTPEEMRAKLRNYFLKTYELFELLFSECFATDETFYVQPEPLRHPHIFYFGHTATFYINKLNISKTIDFRLNPTFESIFAIGVDEMSWDDLNPGNYDWPSVDAVRDYREKAKQVVLDVIDQAPLSVPIGWDDPLWAVLMGIEHERIHIETSSVLIRQTALQHLKSSDFWTRCDQSAPAPQNTLLPVPGGTVALGKPREHNQYGWDNEYGHHEAEITPFQASQFLVSNGEYLEFVQAGGYQNPRFWSREGQQWLEFTQAKHPPFWIPDGAGYLYRALLEEIPLPMDWPVDVNYLEAKAFCDWKSQQTNRSLRLPTEDEWMRLLDHSGIADEPYWDVAPGNINLEHGTSACPVNRFAFKDGFYDVIGNVWQWTETPISGFDGFEVHPWYDDFSTPTFDDKHNLIKGGSWISTGNEANRHSRYAFRRHFFQHAGFRYVEAGENPYAAIIEQSNAQIYETDRLLAQYCEFHYGEEYFGVPNFPKASIEFCLNAMQGRPLKRALDIGCGAGRSTFELARHCEFVHGIDFTARFIRLAIELQEKGTFAYEIPLEGELTETRRIDMDALGLKSTTGVAEFWQGDAANLKPLFTGYDLIFAGNLIDRMYRPEAFLESVHERLNPNGILIIASPYTWLEEFTPKEHWIGGKNAQTTLQGLKKILGGHFRLTSDPVAIPFVIRETERKFQHTLSEFTVWEKLS